MWTSLLGRGVGSHYVAYPMVEEVKDKSPHSPTLARTLISSHSTLCYFQFLICSSKNVFMQTQMYLYLLLVFHIPCFLSLTPFANNIAWWLYHCQSLSLSQRKFQGLRGNPVQQTQGWHPEGRQQTWENQTVSRILTGGWRPRLGSHGNIVKSAGERVVRFRSCVIRESQLLDWFKDRSWVLGKDWGGAGGIPVVGKLPK